MRILLALDGSLSSKAALEEICRRPWPQWSEVRIVTVLSPIEFMILREESRPLEIGDKSSRQQGWDAVNYLESAEEELKRRAPDLRITAALLEGRPKEVILAEAGRWGADLIVLGAHGYGTIMNLPLGSVAFAVLLNATCSVEIVRSRLDNGKAQ